MAASGVDWEFVQGRQQGDVRAAVAERLRRVRRKWDKHLGRGDGAGSAEDADNVPTIDEIVQEVRQRNRTPEYEGVTGDIVIGRNTWKEYIRGIHEGWLGPLALPEDPIPALKSDEESTADKTADGDAKPAEPKKEEAKPTRPRQIPSHNTVDDYPASPLPLLIPGEFNPTAPIPLPHILGFLNTPTRMYRFFNRRATADSIGREVAAVCFCTYRDFRELPAPQTSAQSGEDLQYEQQLVLKQEERDWLKSVWKEAPEENKASDSGDSATQPEPKKELIWPRPMVLDSRIATRMRRFELQPEDEAKARAIRVPETEVEGWIKGSIRSMVHWGVRTISGGEKKRVSVYNDED